MTTLRVLLVNKFYDLRGGTERILFDLEESLRADGHAVAVFATADERNHPTPWQKYFAPGKDYDDPNPRQKLSHAIRAIYDREARRCFARLLAEFRPDVVHFHNIYHQLSPSILDEARDRRLPSVLTLHDYKLACPVYRLFRQGQVCEECVAGRVALPAAWHACSRGSRSESLLLALESSIHRLRHSYERAVDRFICPSQFLATTMERQGLDRAQLTVIENAPRTALDPAPAAARAEAPTLLVATRLSEEKGLDVLLEAAKATPQLTVRIAGEGPAGEELRRRFAGQANVEWLGQLDQTALARERGLSWAVAVPSIWYENAPLAAIEALHAGRPVLASDHGGLVEMVDEGVTGWRALPGDVDAWRGVLERAAAGRDELAEMGDNAARVARERYGFDRFYARHLELYETVMRGK